MFISFLRKIKNSQDIKNLIENFISLSILKIIGYIFPLITLPYLSKIIGVNGFGEIAFATSVIVFFETITDFGFNYTATRDIARNRDDIKKISIIFTDVFFSKLLLMFVSVILFLILVHTIPFFHEKRTILYLTFLYIPGHIIFPEWFFQAIEKMKFITLINFISKLLFTVLVFIVIKNENDYIYQPVLVSLGYLLSGIISLLIIFYNYNIRIVKTSFSNIIETIKGSYNMFISLIMPNLYTNLSVIMLRYFCGETATGIYSSGYKFIDLCNQISQVFSRTFYPFLSRKIDKHTIYVKISGIISILMSFLMFISAEFLINFFYTSDFKHSVIVIKIMSISPFFLFLMNTYGVNFLVLKGKEFIYRNIILFCSIGGCLISYLLVNNFCYIGISIAVTSIWGIRGLLTFLIAKKYK